MIWQATTVPYLPGITPRPDEDVFAPLKASALPGATTQELAQSPTFQFGRAAFDAGFYWEAHELFEHIWMLLPPASAEKVLMKGLIQLANSGLKRRMGRPEAADRIMDLANQALDEAFLRASSPLGVAKGDVTEMCEQIAQTMQYNAEI